ncbi:sensor domain-containing diguanylate cyclase [Pelagibius sp. CAU 1746]|uniref:GGDEF domain-containing protein n=1 Tax=Pelagibius sp. CAU 1746 TaxID=3140370 RepID=UPI00325AC27C
MFEDLLTNALDAIWVIDEEGIIRYVNPAAETLSGYDRRELMDQPLAKILPPAVAAVHNEYLKRYLDAGPQFHIMGAVREFSIVARDGEEIPVGLRAFEIPPPDDKRCFGAIMQDYRPRRKLEAERDALLARLSAQALSDELTGLPNRRAFMDELERVQAAMSRSTAPASIAVIDIDHFKQVNDTYGHGAGDATLRALAAVLRETLRGEDFLARVGGEEFALVLRAADLSIAGRIAERMRERVAETPFTLPEGQTIHITVSIGVAPFSLDCKDQACLKAADKALYKAKEGGRNKVCIACREHAATCAAAAML